MIELRSMRSGSELREEAIIAATIYDNPFVSHDPFDQQIHFLTLDGEEALYGGSAGGGKSEALLMAALQYVDDPNYSALILRRTYKDLALPGALMDRAHQWLQGTSARWNNVDKVWTFPSGATLTFGYLQHSNDKYQYQGSEFQFVGFDELTQFHFEEYSYLHSRLRKLKGSSIPIRMRAASNPGGLGHEWVKERFITGDKPFIPAGYTDNPYLDTDLYGYRLDQLDEVTRQHLKFGNWDAMMGGELFQREWFTQNTYSIINENIVIVLRFWDLAATYEANPENSGGADWTASVLLIKGDSGRIYLEDVVRFRLNPDEAEEKIIEISLADAERYGRGKYRVRIEQEGGASAKYVINNFSKKLAGLDFDGSHIPRRSKLDRARAHVGFIKHGNFKIKEGASWLADFLGEITVFPTKGVHDDQVDALTGGLNELAGMSRPYTLDIYARGFS